MRWTGPGLAAPLLLTAGLLAGCASGPEGAERPTTVWRSGIEFVRIAPQDGAPRAAANDHPVTFEPAEIRRMLRTVELLRPAPGQFFVMIAGGGAQHHAEPVFKPAALERIDAPLAYALAHAGPREDVTFAVSERRRSGPFSLLSETRSTAARMFFRDGELNLIFGDFQVEHGKQRASRDHPYFGYVSKIDEARNPLRPGSRDHQASIPFPLVLRAGDRHADADGESRTDWVAISPEIALTGGAAPGHPADGVGLTQPPAAYFDRPGDAGAGARSSAAAATVEARMARLKQLLDRGLITQDIYDQRAREILADL